jgi:IS5 family transposase
MSYLRKVKSYKNINDPQRSFVAPFVDKHGGKNEFFAQVNKSIDWDPIAKKLKKTYTKGLTDRGAKAYSPLLLFKMHLISQWYRLSDTQTEAMVYDSISALKFCGLTLEDNVPGHSTLSRFKKELTDQDDALNILDTEIETQLAEKKFKIQPGRSRVDAKLSPMQ